MLDQMRSGADTAAEDDFEWVNDWAAASTRPDTPTLPHPAAAIEPATAIEPAPTAPSTAAAVAAMEASPSAEPSPSSTVVVDSVVRAAPPVDIEEPGSTDTVALPTAAEDASDAVAVSSPPAQAVEAIVTVDPIPQSPADVETLPLADTDAPSSERRTWTSLFRLISGAGSAPARDDSVSIMATEAVATEAPVMPTEAVAAETPAMATEAVAAEPPAAVGLSAVPVVQEHATEIPLAPDQLELDIAEIEQVRDQLLSLPEPHLAPDLASGVAAPRSRTSDLVPILVGAALGFVLLVVFGAAASFVSLR